MFRKSNVNEEFTWRSMAEPCELFIESRFAQVYCCACTVLRLPRLCL